MVKYANHLSKMQSIPFASYINIHSDRDRDRHSYIAVGNPRTLHCGGLHLTEMQCNHSDEVHNVHIPQCYNAHADFRE